MLFIMQLKICVVSDRLIVALSMTLQHALILLKFLHYIMLSQYSVTFSLGFSNIPHCIVYHLQLLELEFAHLFSYTLA